MSDEKDILEFLDSLPTEQVVTTKDKEGKSDAEILDFLDELEIDEKVEEKKPMEAKLEPKKVTVAEEELEVELKDQVKEEVKEDLAVREKPMQESESEIETGNKTIETAPESAITTIASWWSNGASERVSTQISSLWGTAQSLSEDAIKKAQKAREQGLDGNLRTVFAELGITGIHEGLKLEGLLSPEQMEEIRKLNLNEAKEAVSVLNSKMEQGLNFVGKTVSEIMGKGEEDEVIEIVLSHDLNNFHGLKEMIRNIFEDVMQKQVDGRINVSVIEKSSNVGAAGNGKVNFGLFHGKSSDAEKLLAANIENEVKLRGNVEGKTGIFVSLIAWTLNKEKDAGDDSAVFIDSYSNSSVTFMCVLKDDVHNISVTTQSQPVPLKWCNWIERSGEERDGSDNNKNYNNSEEEEVEPSEWVIEWVTESIRNLIGITSQSYIIKRMGY